jgi:hypothetical protein
MKKLLVAAVFAGVAVSASAYDDFDRVTVADSADCPAGTAATVASYEWQDGHLVRNGWVCESIYSGR